jgi:hypothetical protein
MPGGFWTRYSSRVVVARPLCLANHGQLRSGRGSSLVLSLEPGIAKKAATLAASLLCLAWTVVTLVARWSSISQEGSIVRIPTVNAEGGIAEEPGEEG